MDSINSQPASDGIFPIGRIDSGETDDSPFCSNLVTPTDDHTIARTQIRDGIEQRITAASLDYFTSGRTDGTELDTTLFEAPAQLEKTKAPLEQPVSVSLNHTSESGDGVPSRLELPVIVLADTSNLSTLGSNQTLPSSHSSLAEVVAQARRSSSALYNLPNSHISIDHKTSDSGSEDEGDDTILQEDLLLREDQSQSTPDLLFTVPWPEDLRTVFSNFTIRSLYYLACRILLFFPWCIAVGGAIILSPKDLSSLAFAPSVDYVSRPPTPIGIFAHWADYGLQHITIFSGFIFTILWTFPNAGTLLLGAMFAQFCWAWHDFLPEQTTALGEDERQMIYHLARRTWLTGDTVNIHKLNGKYYATNLDHEPNSDPEESNWSSVEDL